MYYILIALFFIAKINCFIMTETIFLLNFTLAGSLKQRKMAEVSVIIVANVSMQSYC